MPPPARRESGAAPRRQPAVDWIALWPVAAMGVLVMAVLAGLYLYSRQGGQTPRPAPSAAASVVDIVSHLDVDRTAALGSAGIANPLRPARGRPPLAGADGRPVVLYVGAEYCPYCAAERWSLLVALSRFGTLSGVGLTSSSATDIYPSTPTLTFAGATYASAVIELQAIEIADRDGKPLREVSAAQRETMQALDGRGSIPFVDIGNRQYAVGAGFLPDALQGLTWEQVARNLQDLSNPLARQVIGNANWLTAAICQASGDQAPVCQAPAIKSLESQLAS